MKKAITILLTLMMLTTLCACGKKKTVKITIVNDKGDNFAYGVETKADYLVEALRDTGKQLGLTFEMDNDEVTKINDLKVGDDSYWQLIVNGKESDSKVGEQQVNDGDEFSFIYTVKTAVEETTQEPAKEEKPEEKIEEKPQEETVQEELLGGWEVYDDFTALLEKEEKEIFEKGLDGITGVGYEPIRVLATQLVSGMNYAYLVQGQTVGVEGKDYYIISIYKDTQGICELKSINKLEVPNLMTKESDENDFVGAWTAKENEKKTTMAKPIQSSFEKAIKAEKDITYEPVQLLATQLVAGTNYMALCLGKGKDEDAKPEIYVVTWYEDLQHNSSLSEIKLLNLNYYTAGE